MQSPLDDVSPVPSPSTENTIQPSVSSGSQGKKRLGRRVSFAQDTSGVIPATLTTTRPPEFQQIPLGSMGQMLRNTTGTVVKSAVQMASQQVLRIQDVLEHSPAARIFVYTGATLSIIPLGIFGVWVGMTLLGTVISAIIGAMIVEGGLVLLGLSVLIPVEGTILAIAGATAVTYATSGVGMRFIQRYGQTFYTIAGQVSRRLALTTGENEDKGTQRQLSHHEIRRHDRHPEHPSSSRSSYTVSTAYVTTEESLNFSPPKTRTEGSMGSGASTKKKRRVKVSSSRSGTTGRIKSRKSPTGSRYSSPPPL